MATESLATKTQPTGWQDKVVSVDMKADPGQLLANPQNWRIHPRAQRAALAGLLDAVGMIAPILVNVTTGHVIDGHMRVEEAIKAGATVPVFYLDLTPDEEKLVLASYDPIGMLATQDVDKHRELLTEVSHSHADLHKLLAQHCDFGDAVGPPKPTSDGSLLRLASVTIRDPQHLVAPGDLWRVGSHRLLCEPVVGDPAAWLADLRAFSKAHGDLAVFAPFPGPLVTLTRKAEHLRLFMVQPDPYIAGHILDRSAEVLGGDAIARLRAGRSLDDPTPEELDPPAAPAMTSKRAKRKVAA